MESNTETGPLLSSSINPLKDIASSSDTCWMIFTANKGTDSEAKEKTPSDVDLKNSQLNDSSLKSTPSTATSNECIITFPSEDEADTETFNEAMPHTSDEADNVSVHITTYPSAEEAE